MAILDLKTDNFEKFTVDGNAFQTLITRSTKNSPEARCASGLKQFILVTSCTTSNTKLEKIGEVYTGISPETEITEAFLYLHVISTNNYAWP